MKARRLRNEPAHLEITAFMSTAVFTRLAVLDLTLPAQSSGAAEQLKVDNLQLEVVVRADALEVGNRIGGLIQRIAATDKGHDLKSSCPRRRSTARNRRRCRSTSPGCCSNANPCHRPSR
ncbi:MAG TPA: hypothetical protein VGQ23_03500 [Burkholderiaceae bacterium]|jgi:hypothetical protein|nr:hypothetical protein [Burkholderiaceae bacterium]